VLINVPAQVTPTGADAQTQSITIRQEQVKRVRPSLLLWHAKTSGADSSRTIGHMSGNAGDLNGSTQH
jgi:hypothetical protein